MLAKSKICYGNFIQLTWATVSKLVHHNIFSLKNGNLYFPYKKVIKHLLNIGNILN